MAPNHPVALSRINQPASVRKDLPSLKNDINHADSGNILGASHLVEHFKRLNSTLSTSFSNRHLL